MIFIVTASCIFIANAFCYAGQEKDHVCFRVVDANEDGSVTFQEFKKIYGDEKAKFEKVDLDQDGLLSHDEYHHFLGHGDS